MTLERMYKWFVPFFQNRTTKNPTSPLETPLITLIRRNRPNHDNDDNYTNDGAQNNDHLAIFPPIFSFQRSRALFELRRSFLQRICSVVQLRQFRITFQNLLHVHFHYADNLIHLGLSLLKSFTLRTRRTLIATSSRLTTRRWLRHVCKKYRLFNDEK